MKYHFKIHKEGDGFWAECLELPGCVAQGDKVDELYDNMYDALDSYVSEPEDSKDFAAFPDDSIKTAKNIVEIALDPEVAFSFLLRYYRVIHKQPQKLVFKPRQSAEFQRS